MAQKKLGFRNTELRNAVLTLIDSGRASDFQSAFAIVMHDRDIFHSRPGQKETYNVYFRRTQPMVMTVLKARQLPRPTVTCQPKRQVPVAQTKPRYEFRDLFIAGKLSRFTPDP